MAEDPDYQVLVNVDVEQNFIIIAKPQLWLHQ